MIKKITSIIIVFILCVTLYACGDVSNVKIIHVDSDIFSQDDITAAENVIINEFRTNLSGCTLKELYYAGDGWVNEFERWKSFYDADEAIVLLSSYDVNSDSPTAKAGTTYSEFNWILVRNDNDKWEFKQCGYC